MGVEEGEGAGIHCLSPRKVGGGPRLSGNRLKINAHAAFYTPCVRGRRDSLARARRAPQGGGQFVEVRSIRARVQLGALPQDLTASNWRGLMGATLHVPSFFCSALVESYFLPLETGQDGPWV